MPYLVSAGFSADYAATFFAGVNAAGLVGNLIFGFLSSRWGAKPILLSGVVVAAGGILLLLMAHDAVLGFGAVTLFSLTWGATFNLASVLSPMLLADAMGSRNFGSLLGIGNLISGLGAALGPAIVGFLVDATRTYNLALLFCAGLMACAIVPTALLHQRAAPGY